MKQGKLNCFQDKETCYKGIDEDTGLILSFITHHFKEAFILQIVLFTRAVILGTCEISSCNLSYSWDQRQTCNILFVDCLMFSDCHKKMALIGHLSRTICQFSDALNFLLSFKCSKNLHSYFQLMLYEKTKESDFFSCISSFKTSSCH